MQRKKIYSPYRVRKFPAILFFILFVSTASAQDSTVTKKDSVGIQRAIYWTKKGQHEKAKNICQAILKKYPHHTETEILLGRLYSWSEQFDSARLLLKAVVDREPANEEALNAIINVELWSEKLDQALLYCKQALAQYPKSESLLLKKAKVLNKKHDYKEASKAIDQILQINPFNKDALEFREYLKKKTAGQPEKNAIGISYRYDYFNNTYAPWNFASMNYFHRGKGANILASINYANRFHVNGIQYELNLYPRISSSLRAYAGGAYSGDSIFPAYNIGAGLYYKLFKKAELELGARYLNFTRLPDPIIIYTGAFSISQKRVFGSIRTYLSSAKAGLNQSYYLTGRYYMKDPKKNITLVLNTGLSPHDYFDPISNKTYNYPARSRRIRLAYQTPLLSKKNILKFSLGYERRVYYAGNSRDRVSAGIDIERLF